MRLVIAGGRDFTDRQELVEFLNALAVTHHWDDITIISGGARGADRLGEQIAKASDLPLKVYPADWDKYGKAAGYIRNNQMADVADILVACWDGQSRGTKHMIETMRKLNKPVHILEY